MKTLVLLCVIACAMLPLQVAANEESPYDALATFQTLDTVYSYTLEAERADQLASGNQKAGQPSQQSDRFFGWVDKPTEPKTKIEVVGEATPKASSDQAKRGLIVAPYDGPPLGPNDLPYVDAEGFTGNNYAIFLTATWCHWCHKMYDDVVGPLRKDGFKVFVIDVDEFPDIKDRIYRRDPTAEKMGRGVPYFVIREGGETKKIYYGYTTAGYIRPHMKKPRDPEPKPEPDNPYDLR